MFKNAKIRTKLLIGFVSVAVIAGIIGLLGISQMKKIATDDKAMYETVVVPLGQCTQLSGWVQRLRVNAAEIIILANKPEEQKKKHDRFLMFNMKLDSLLALYEPTIIDSIDRRNYNTLKAAKKEYVDFFPGYMSLIEAGKIEEASDYMNGDWYKAASKMQKIADVLIDYNVVSGKLMSDNNTKIASSASLEVMIFIVLGVIIALILGFYIAANIQLIIKSVVDQTKILSKAAVDGKLATRGNPEEINVEFREIIYGVNDTLDAVIGPLNVSAEYIDRISKGNIPAKKQIIITVISTRLKPI